MAENNAGGLERLLEDLVRRVVESSLTSFQQQIRKELREGLAGAAAAGPRGEVGAGSSAAAEAAPAAPPPAPSVLPAVNQAVSRILQPTGQSEIMAAFLQNAAGFAGRCALFVRRGDSYAFWRAEGFPMEAGAQLRAVSVSASQPGIFKEVSDNQLAVSALHSSEALPASLLQALGASAEGSLYLFPVVVQGRLVAALYGDSGANAGSVDPSALEILARVAGLSLETAAGRAAASAAHPVMTPAEAPAMAAAAVPAEAPPPVAAPAIPPPPDPETLPEQDRDVHRKAYRSARVAVQDMLAYPQNKVKVEEGRKNKTLYRSLKEDIDKTRETYQKKYGQTAARSFDYFHYELVTKLAENDPEVLGSDYPGPVE
ncbi:MAG: hypothetical protein A3J28_14860 [Acidobacteria bacterium RIFCSPLOWO2_12_FULL_60_22]|nr:MAG: hypothetical protein A3J28_14860 [Acidobacteria bacterium RIFCSPLOWO2_12_FULL_60_22]